MAKLNNALLLAMVAGALNLGCATVATDEVNGYGEWGDITRFTAVQDRHQEVTAAIKAVKARNGYMSACRQGDCIQVSTGYGQAFVPGIGVSGYTETDEHRRNRRYSVPQPVAYPTTYENPQGRNLTREVAVVKGRIDDLRNDVDTLFVAKQKKTTPTTKDPNTVPESERTAPPTSKENK